MKDGLSVLAFIPARGGSKGIKNKNLTPVSGRPLISYTIHAALQSRFIDDVFVSTDSETIADAAGKLGAWVPFLRPARLAGDHSNIVDSVIYSIDALLKRGKHYDVIILLQPTQPLRTTADIDGALTMFFAHNFVPLASVSPVSDNPVLIRTIDDNGLLQKLLAGSSTIRRQDMPLFYRIDGSIYINLSTEITASTSFNDNPLPYIMPLGRAVDIDEPADIAIAEYYLKYLEMKKEG